MDAWKKLEQLHNLVNNGDFSVFEARTTDIVVALLLSPKVVTWLLNTKVATMQQQILHWLAAWSALHSDLPEQGTCLPVELSEIVEHLKRQYYSQRFPSDEIWESGYPTMPREFQSHYERTSKEVTGAAPPEILRLLDYQTNSILADDWGLTRIQFSMRLSRLFSYQYVHIRRDDWESYVIHGETTDIGAAEAREDIRQNWLHTLELYPQRKTHIFEVSVPEATIGFVYLLRGSDSRRFKIGFTAGEAPYGRISSLQTGSSEKLEEAGFFPAASIKTEEVVHCLFEGKRIRSNGEWFSLSDEDVDNLLREEWRISHNIF